METFRCFDSNEMHLRLLPGAAISLRETGA
jgi:hypothetical protein